MKVVLQRVSRAAVSVDGEVIGAIGKGFLLLLGVSDTDTEQTADRMVDKTVSYTHLTLPTNSLV